MKLVLKRFIYAVLVCLMVDTSELRAQQGQLVNNSNDSINQLEFARFSYLTGHYNDAFQTFLRFTLKHKSNTKSDWIKFRGAAVLLGNQELEKVDGLYLMYGDPMWRDQILVNVDISNGDFKAHRLDWNTDEFEEFAPVFLLNRLYFTSSRPNLNMDLGKYHLNQQAYYDVYWLDSSGNPHNGNLFSAKFAGELFNSHLHDGPFTSLPDGSRIVLTRNAPTKQGELGLALFESEYNSEKKQYSKWKRIKNLPNRYNCQHPFFDEVTGQLYFSSDMPGGYGGFDIYKMEYTQSGWSNPVNLGKSINTAGDEVFPTIYKERFFFSSNGYKSTGNLDIMLKDEFGTRELERFNSIWDDYYPLFLTDSSGYFCSNRFNGFATDDILAFKYLEFPKLRTIEFIFDYVVSDTVLTKVKINVGGRDSIFEVLGSNFKLSLPLQVDLKHIEISYKTEGFNPVDTKIGIPESEEKTIRLAAEKIPEKAIPVLVLDVREDPNIIPTGVGNLRINFSIDGIDFSKDSGSIFAGNFTESMPIWSEKSFIWLSYTVTYKGYLKLSDSLKLNITDLDTIYLNMFSPRLNSLQKTKEGIDIGKYYNVGMIYFDVNKYNIREDAAIELNKIIKALNENPEISIELGSHTDCRGSTASNEKLSHQRAESSARYIVEKGNIRSERISYKGYGESQIINKCVDGIPCTPEEHALNRRTEFKITNIKLD